MKVLDKPLQSLTAEDLMTSSVLTIYVNMSVGSAARMLTLAGVSGAPVVNDAGHCVGVLSTTDFLKRVGQDVHPGPFSPHVDYDWQIPESDAVPNECVGSLMTADPVTVSRDSRLGHLARLMLDAHIHRVIVVDGYGQPIGVVSTTDVLAAVAQFAPDEGES